MAYDVSKDPHSGTLLNFGTKSRTVVPHDDNDIVPYPKAIVATSAGNLVVLPAHNDDGAIVAFTGIAPGFVPPLRVRRVLASGTTCGVATIE